MFLVPWIILYKCIGFVKEGRRSFFELSRNLIFVTFKLPAKKSVSDTIPIYVKTLLAQELRACHLIIFINSFDISETIFLDIFLLNFTLSILFFLLTISNKIWFSIIL